MHKESKHSRLLQAALLILFSVLAIGCGKKCQQNTTLYKTVTATEWRLAETTDPALAQNLTKFNFLIAAFGKNFTGALYQVVDNEKKNNPAAPFTFNVSTADRQLEITYQSNETGEGIPSGTKVTYSYSVGYQLNLTNLATGHTYRYVPMQGVADPDSDCVF